MVNFIEWFRIYPIVHAHIFHGLCKLHVMYKHAFLEMSSPEEDGTIMNDTHGSSINSQLWKPSFLSKLRAAAKSHVPQYLGWVYATQQGRTTMMERAGHKTHQMNSPWAGEAQYRHSTHEEGKQLHNVSCSLVAAEGSDTQTLAVLALHSAYKCRNLSLVISSTQHLPLLGLFSPKTAHYLHVFRCTHVQMHREIYWISTV